MLLSILGIAICHEIRLDEARHGIGVIGSDYHFGGSLYLREGVFYRHRNVGTRKKGQVVEIVAESHYPVGAQARGQTCNHSSFVDTGGKYLQNAHSGHSIVHI